MNLFPVSVVFSRQSNCLMFHVFDAVLSVCGTLQLNTPNATSV